MTTEIKKICTNCILVGNDLISYETVVATVDTDKRTLTQLGKWSKTTQKHINLTAKFLGLTLIKP